MRKGRVFLKKNILRSGSVLKRILLTLAAFAAALLLQLGIGSSYTRLVVRPMEQRTQNILAISQFVGSADRYAAVLDNCRWDSNDLMNFSRNLRSAREESMLALDAVHVDLGQVSEEQYLIASAVKTTFASYKSLTDDVLSLMKDGELIKASTLYFDKMAPCGSYVQKYSRQLLEQAIQDNFNEYQRIMGTSNLLRILQAVSLLVCLVVGVSLVISIRTLAYGVRNLSDSSREISNGNLDTADLSDIDDNEIGDMNRAFNEMKHSMKRQVKLLEEKNEIEQALLRKENEALELQNHMERSQLQLLRSQVDPHFLFNTLNAIMYTAQQEAATKTYTLLGALSRLFRYSLGSNAAQVSLAREIHITESFYSLYRARFGSRLNLQWEIAPDIDPQIVMMPSFILQPLAENAFRHGIAPKEEGGLVTMRIFAEGGILHIRVEDNGVGMKAEDLKALQEKLRKSDIPSSHIGVYNVAARTRMLGDKYGMDFESVEGQGTVAALRLPLVLEEEDYDAEDDDC